MKARVDITYQSIDSSSRTYLEKHLCIGNLHHLVKLDSYSEAVNEKGQDRFVFQTSLE
jgi:hypothetical protein